MEKSTFWKDFKMSAPATYRIRIKGYLESNWSDRLGGMAITTETVADQMAVTILVGHMVDQAALFGVLNTLYDLHLPLLSVENIDEPRT